MAHRVLLDQVPDLVGEHRGNLVVVPGGGDQLVEEHDGAARQRERIGADRRTLAEFEHVAAAGQAGEGVEAGRQRCPPRLGELRRPEGQAIERGQRLRAHLPLDTGVHARGDDPGQRRHAEDDAAPHAGDDQCRGDERGRPSNLELVDPPLHAGRRVPGDLGQLERRLDQATGAIGQVEAAWQIAEPRLEPDATDRDGEVDGVAAQVHDTSLDADPHRVGLRRAAVVVGGGATGSSVWRSRAAHSPKSRSIASLSSEPVADSSPADASAAASSGPAGSTVSDSAR